MPTELAMKERVDQQEKYRIAAGKTNYTPDFVVRNTLVSKKAERIPNIIGWSGPARSGTTALLFLLANSPQVDRVYFQPQKTILRKGGPAFVLHPDDRLICMKEVFGQMYPDEVYDPIDLLLKSGVPASKITWISFMRDPVQTFASWNNLVPSSPKTFAKVQAYTIEHFNRYRSMGIKVVPFVYDLLRGTEPKVVAALLERIGLESPAINLDFDQDIIQEKFVGGQAQESEYFKINIEPTLAKHKFVYSRNNYGLSDELADEVRELCQEAYDAFADMARAELGVD